jgi:PAS domain S-box-containing protein
VKDRLQLLIVEDSDDDAELISLTLRRGGFETVYERVDQAEAMRAALQRGSWDIVIADYTLPHFSGLQALQVLHESGLDLPFLIVSGTINEEMAVAAIKAGAHDYILKHNLSRIIPAAERELREAVNRAERRKVEQQVQIQQYLLDQVNVAVMACDLKFQTIYWNRHAEALFGWHHEEIIGQNIYALLTRPADYDLIAPHQQTLKTAGYWEGEVDVRRRDGSDIPIHSAHSPLLDAQGALLGYVSVSADITERKRVEEERAKLLARERAARAEAEAANRAKDEFLATVSHELRTPLNAMLGWIYLLRTGKLDPATYERALETIERNTRLQAQLIEDLLDVSRIIAGKLRLNVRPTDVSPVIIAAIESVRLAAEAKGIECRLMSDPGIRIVMCDPDRLQQVIWNLLANAIKFTPKGGRVTVQLQRADDSAEIIVSDTGQGISADFLPFVFDRFRQADSTPTRAHGGIGLGLSIVRHLVELHGGTVTAESAGHEQGAKFVVRLPLSGGQSREAEVIRREDLPGIASLRLTALEGLRVVVVDDDPDARELLTTLLGKCRVDVRAVATVVEALRVIHEQRPDVIVSDIAMPDENGYDLIRQVRQLEPERGGLIPAVALTAYARDEDRTKTLAAGFQAHLTKPVEPAELTAIIASLARRAANNLITDSGNQP